ncbi:MAG: hypothetical protein EOS73_14120 [Mesorhizobium sp.]|nr:MAG: hypothetical protein EOS27_25820 [Mesorhizobium sp.]RWD08618.1 MAG: hypothetical protein EOS73_14120 [Mesorhizobium sp.]
MTEPGHGHVILSYLWAREFDRGEESGRKARPTCVMVIVAGKDGWPHAASAFCRAGRIVKRQKRTRPVGAGSPVPQ